MTTDRATPGHLHGYVTLLRAVNVGGTGKLAMSDLVELCRALGWHDVRTYIASGNVVLRAADTAAGVKAKLEAALARHAGKPVGVVVRTPAEMAQVLRDNPFPDRAPNRTVAIFLDHPPPPDALDRITGRGSEELALGVREVYVHYGDGMGTSKLKIPAATAGTARNLNTVAKLVELAAALDE